MIELDLTGINAEINERGAREAYGALLSGECAGADMRGWLNAPEASEGALDRIDGAAARIRDMSDTLVVIGVGGSYLGARAAIDFICSPDYNALPKRAPDIRFAGTSLSGDALSELLTILEGRDFCLNIVSKSGSTAEPAAAFRVLRAELERRYGSQGAAKRIFATTDEGSGALSAEAEENGWETFPIPRGVGGRYSVLTPVGLLPMAAAGIDIRASLRGAGDVFGGKSEVSAALAYAAAREALYASGKSVELFASFEPHLRSLGEWWKQLFGESCGKAGGGLFPAAASYTADLHSLGQYVQEGARLLFETLLTVKKSRSRLAVPGGGFAGAESLSGKAFDFLNASAFEAVKRAHTEGGVPVAAISVPERGAESFGALVAFFELACAVSCVMRGVNAFDQPGVEAYKRNMKELFAK